MDTRETQWQRGQDHDGLLDDLEAPLTAEEIEEDRRGWDADAPADHSPRDLDSWLTRTPASDFDEEC